ncbi:ribbon-helix-helix domain-containing protein [Planktothrix sp. PCC 11201]|uniref:ribbon-helix-helix domain-containing protein n=1 Tax=Planktothrix sp. PCC 11201 TaxID=1729650 RepID=UPI0009A6D062|nr:hypothetical protein [Planktothrix sp. PCC 11201]
MTFTQSAKAVPTNLSKTMVYMPDELKEALVKWAKRENRSLSNLIVTLLQESVKNAKSKDN